MEATTATTTTLMRSLSVAPCPRRRLHVPTFPLSPAAPHILPLCRARSDADLVRSIAASASVLLRSPRQQITEEDAPIENCFGGYGAKNKGNSGSASVHGGGGGGSRRQSADMGEHYRRVLRLEPDNPLLLRNYGKYLHEVERDLAGAEEYYGRALRACPGDADLLSLYGHVLWEVRQDKDRAAGYFERAVQAAPNDCYVLGSYASFLWNTEDDEDDEVAAVQEKASVSCGSGCRLDLRADEAPQWLLRSDEAHRWLLRAVIGLGDRVGQLHTPA